MARRTNLNGLPAADRTVLVNLILRYLTDAVVDAHRMITHAGAHLLTGHRQYIEGLEAFLTANGGGRFVPLPKWDPGTPIPPEFRVVKAEDDGTHRPALVNFNPQRPMSGQFAPPAVCTFSTADALGNAVDGWHGGVHTTIGGTMSSLPIASAAPIFWCWHGFIDDIYHDWEQCRGPLPAFIDLALGGPLLSTAIGQAGEVDMYRFQVPTTARYRIETAGNTDVLMSLFGPNSSSEFVAEDDDSGPGSNALIVGTLSPGTYYLRVRHYSTTGTGTYQIGVRIDAPAAIPTLVVNGAALPGNIGAANESDFYTFRVNAPGAYTIETGGTTDTFVTLYGPDSQTRFIAEDDDSGPGLNSRIVVANLTPGAYFVAVRHYDLMGMGPYTLAVRRQ